MNSILNNPYRLLGLLVGASALQLNRHRTRIPNYISAGSQIPTEFTDFSFDLLGRIDRTEANIENSAAKLNLDSDKMSAAIFWFYKGNPITDEPAFDAIKDADLNQAINIWTKLTSNGEITQRNASAYNNLGTLYLSGILKGTNTNEAILEHGISLKLKFLESDLIKDFKALVTDETYKTTKKEFQLLFLNQVQSEVEKSGVIAANKLIDIINKHEFSAKEDFIKGFVQKLIEQIEHKIETAKNKRKASKANGAKAGQEVYTATATDLIQIKSIVGATDLKYTSISDKVANEILQCSIDYFNDSQEKDSSFDYVVAAMKLAKQAETLAIGKLTRDRVKDSIETLAEMKDREISQAIQVLKSIKDAYDTNKADITAKVRQQEQTDIQIILGEASINWDKVNHMIESSINWDKAVELVQEVVPRNNIDKIKNVKNQANLNEYKSLVNFLLSKLTYSNQSKVSYLRFWEAPKTIKSSDWKFSEIFPWAVAVIAIIIGLAIGAGWASLIIGFFALGIGAKIAEWFE